MFLQLLKLMLNQLLLLQRLAMLGQMLRKLLRVLDDAENLLSKAKLAYNNSDFNSAFNFAVQSQDKLNSFVRVLIYPRTEFFTELWILDSNHRAENYPFNITRNQNCNVFLGIGNHLGYCAYYLVEVKFRNQTQPEPTNFGPIGNRTPNPLPSLFNITAFVAINKFGNRL
ncbi:hypothetical protein DRO59_06810 [Candidatus Bathyarchaeota archaeon]|nr:MAG: hypothetical protein DRO59_06810 [Candidatus Bathyarchaeota archaeon]